MRTPTEGPVHIEFQIWGQDSIASLDREWKRRKQALIWLDRHEQAEALTFAAFTNSLFQDAIDHLDELRTLRRDKALRDFAAVTEDKLRDRPADVDEFADDEVLTLVDQVDDDSFTVT